MGAYTIFDKLREFIGHVGWKAFLWANRYTVEQFHRAVYEDLKVVYEGVKVEKGGEE